MAAVNWRASRLLWCVLNGNVWECTVIWSSWCFGHQWMVGRMKKWPRFKTCAPLLVLCQITTSITCSLRTGQELVLGESEGALCPSQEPHPMAQRSRSRWCRWCRSRLPWARRIMARIRSIVRSLGRIKRGRVQSPNLWGDGRTILHPRQHPSMSH